MQLDDLFLSCQSQLGSPLEPAGDQLWRLSKTGDEWVVMLSEDQSWVRFMVPIAGVAEAQPFLQELLQLNFEATTLVKYAIAQQMLWGVFNHPLATLTEENLHLALECLSKLRAQGLSQCFEVHADRQVRLIILASKRQGLTLKATLQNLERFYREGIIGDLSDTDATIQLTLNRWRDRLERLWAEVEAKPAS